MDPVSLAGEATALVQSATQLMQWMDQFKQHASKDTPYHEDVVQCLDETFAVRSQLDQILPRGTSELMSSDRQSLERPFDIFYARLAQILDCIKAETSKQVSTSRTSRILFWKKSRRNDKLVSDLISLKTDISAHRGFLNTLLKHTNTFHAQRAHLFETRMSAIPHRLQMSDQQEARHSWYSKARLENTCRWFTESEEFATWLASDGPSFLWVQGAPGCGKSTVMSHVIDYLTAGTQSQRSSALAYYYMAAGKAQRSKDLSSSIEQHLLRFKSELPLESDHLRYGSCSGNHSVDEPFNPGFATPWSVPFDAQRSALRGARGPQGRRNVLQKTRILIDSWSEENMIDSSAFDDVLRTYARCGYSLLIFSRVGPRRVAQDKGWDWKLLELTLDRNRDDVFAYANAVISANPSFGEWLAQDEKTTTRAKDQLIDISAGSFFRCALQLELVLSQRSRKDLSKVVEMLCSNSPEPGTKSVGRRTDIADYKERQDAISGDPAIVYMIDWALKALLQQQASPESERLVRRTLTWLSLTVVCEPLSIMGLCESLTIILLLEQQPGRSTISDISKDDVLTPQSVLTSCKGFIWIDPGTSDVALADYNLERRLQEAWSADRTAEYVQLSTACLHCLLFDTFQHGPCVTLVQLQRRLQGTTFFRFASHNWLYYYVHSQASASWGQAQDDVVPLDNDLLKRSRSAMHTLALKLLKSRQHLLSAVQAMFHEDDRDDIHFAEVLKKINAMSTLGLAAALGLKEIISSMLDTPLEESLLLNVSSDLDSDQINIEELFDQLTLCLFNTSDMDSLYAKDPVHHVATTKEGAIRLRRSKVCSVLSEDFVVELICSDHEIVQQHAKSLVRAAASRHMHEMVERLLDQLPKYHSKHDSDWTSMAWVACERGDSALLSILLRRQLLDRTGAVEGNKHDSHHGLPPGETPLQAACKQGNLALVKMLIDYGVDLKSPEGSHANSPLVEAITRGHDKIAAMLLGAGAVLGRSSLETPLHVACRVGNDQLVEMLLQYGANPKASGRGGRTPLMEAVDKGREDIVLLLLHAGAIINPKETPLHAAVRNALELGHTLRILELLLASVANVHMKDADGKEATQLLQDVNGKETAQRLGVKREILDLFERFDYKQTSILSS